MIDNATQQELKKHFARLDQDLELLVWQSETAADKELREMLDDVAACSDRISIRLHPEKASGPQFEIHRGGRFSGIRFRGIPGGHEFTSLIVALLNAGGLGKMPDDALQQRIRNLQGPVRLSTWISLSCDNCPDVVQALNQMALIHDDFVHEMVDGAVFPEEAQALELQGVPAVLDGDNLLIHSGRGNLAGLLTTLEEHLGHQGEMIRIDPGHFQVAVIGGGPAGATAAIYSARKGLKTVLIAERAGGQVADTKGIENLIAVDYIEGKQLAADLFARLESNDVHLLEHRRVTGIQKGEIHTLNLQGGGNLTADRVIIATGAKWRELGVPGEKEHIGRGVAFCPHCDGPVYKGKSVAVVGGGNSGVEAAIDLAGIVRDVVLIEFLDELRADQVLLDRLHSLPNVRVITGARTTAVNGDGRKVTGLTWENRADGSTNELPLDGIFVQIGLSPNSQGFRELVECNKHGEIEVDAKGRTSVPGIYAAGDVTTVPFKQIVISMGDGARAALAAFEDRLHAKPA